MGIINGANLRKALYYLKRNGIRKTYYGIREKLDMSRLLVWQYNPPGQEELERQRREAAEKGFTAGFSIVVPAYRTPGEYLRQLLESVLGQSYGRWELILADATEDDSVRQILADFQAERGLDERIRYHRLQENKGIAENTNEGIALARMEYVGLLDHDDFLGENALYEVAKAVEEQRDRGIVPQLIYTDEDKCSGDRSRFYEPNVKGGFNFEMLLTNNYICHFMVLKRELIQELKLRKEFDGAQDFDLALRAAGRLEGREEEIINIPRVLYHWRCHESSTAENPMSKLYAYEAGRRAVQDFADKKGWQVRVRDTAHLGFYEISYSQLPPRERKNIAAVGGRIIGKGCVMGGRMSEQGEVFYKGLPGHYSGYMHRAVLAQEAEALDIRNLAVVEDCRGLVEEITGIPYATAKGSHVFDAFRLPEHTDYAALSLQVSRALREKGYKLLYLPGQVPDVIIRADGTPKAICKVKAADS